MRVMTWNLWWRFGDRWRERQPRIAETLAAVGPDVAALQEVWCAAGTTQAHVLADKLGLHAAYGAPSLPPPPRPPESPDQTGVEVAVAVLSRWPIAAVRKHPLPSRHRSRIVALAVVIDHPRGPLHVVTTCIDGEPDDDAQRLVQTKALADLVTDPSRDGPLPTLLMGDLNAPPDSPEIQALTSVMVDAWPAAAVSAEGGSTLCAGNPQAPRDFWLTDQRIDYILGRPGSPEHPIRVDRAFLAGEQARGGLCPSDHYAVVADLHI